MCKIILAFSVLLLSSCISFPLSPKQLAATAKISDPTCVKDDIAIVNSRIDKYLDRCYTSRKKVYVSNIDSTPNYSIAKKDNSYYITAYVKQEQAYLFGITLFDEPNKTETCHTQITQHAFNSMWALKFSTMKAVANGEDPSCPL